MVSTDSLNDKLTAQNFVIAIVIAVAGGLTMNYVGVLDAQEPTEGDITAVGDGDFETFQPIQELTGYNDLDVTEQALNASGQVDDGNVVTSFNVNSTNGETLRLAFGLEVDDSVSDINVEVAPSSQAIADGMDVRGVEIVRDNDDERDLGDASVVSSLSADSDDEVDATVRELTDGDYAVVMEVRSTDVASLTGGEDLYDIALEGSGDEYEDVYVTLDNAQ